MAHSSKSTNRISPTDPIEACKPWNAGSIVRLLLCTPLPAFPSSYHISGCMLGHGIVKGRSGVITDGYADACLDELLAAQEASPYLNSTTDEDGDFLQPEEADCRASLLLPVRMEDLLQDDELWERPLKLDAKQLEGIRGYFESGFFEASPTSVPPAIASVTTKVIEKAKDAVVHRLTKCSPACGSKRSGPNRTPSTLASPASTDNCAEIEAAEITVETRQFLALRNYLCKTYLDRAEGGAFKIPMEHISECMQTFLNIPKDKSPRLVMDKKQLDEFCEIFNIEYDYAEFASEASKRQAATAIEKANEVVESRIKQLASKIGALEAKIQASPTPASKSPSDTFASAAARDAHGATRVDGPFPPDVLQMQDASDDSAKIGMCRGACSKDPSPADPCMARQQLFLPGTSEEHKRLPLQDEPRQQQATAPLVTSTERDFDGLLSELSTAAPLFDLTGLEGLATGSVQRRKGKKKKKPVAEQEPAVAEHTDELSRLSNETLADLAAAEQLPEQFRLEPLPSDDSLLATPADSLVEQLQHMHLIYSTREAHFRAILARHQLATQLIRTRATQLSMAMRRLSERVQHAEAQQSLQHGHEDQLRGQLRLYVEKFKQVEQTLARSNDLFVSFRKEMEQTSAKLGKLEKDNQLLQTKNATLSRNIVEMADECAKQAATIETLAAQKTKLASLCRTMQNERNVALGRASLPRAAAAASQGHGSTAPK